MAARAYDMAGGCAARTLLGPPPPQALPLPLAQPLPPPPQQQQQQHHHQQQQQAFLHPQHHALPAAMGDVGLAPHQLQHPHHVGLPELRPPSLLPADVYFELAAGVQPQSSCSVPMYVGGAPAQAAQAAGAGAGLGAGPAAVGALPPGPRRPNLRAIQFISRHAMDGKFLFVDQRATLVLGFLPQELHGTSMYEYYHHEDISLLAEAHKAALQGSERVITQVYRFRSKDGSFVRLQSEWKSFRNPWTKDVEYLVAKNSLVLMEHVAESTLLRPECTSQSSFDYFSQCELRSPAMQSRQGWLTDPTVRDDMSSGDRSMAAVAAANGGRDIQCLIKTHVEASKIGRQIAEAVLDTQRRGSDSSSGVGSPSPGADTFFGVQPLSNLETQISTSAVVGDRQQPNRFMMLRPNHNNNNPSSFNNIRNNVQLTGASDPGVEADDMMEMIGGSILPDSPHPSASNDGNDEAAMAVIMSLLEADAGLGGPVDFSGLPWPLP